MNAPLGEFGFIGREIVPIADIEERVYGEMAGFVKAHRKFISSPSDRIELPVATWGSGEASDGSVLTVNPDEALEVNQSVYDGALRRLKELRIFYDSKKSADYEIKADEYTIRTHLVRLTRYYAFTGNILLNLDSNIIDISAQMRTGHDLINNIIRRHIQDRAIAERVLW